MRTTIASNMGDQAPHQLAAQKRGVRWTFFLAGLGILVVLVIASLSIGKRPLSPLQVFQALVAPQQDTVDAVVWLMRLPRTAMALLVGAALGMAGALMQALTRNPLADPGLLGVNAGASFAVALGMVLLGPLVPGVFVPLALLGAGAGTLVVYALGAVGAGGATPVKLTLAGVALSAALGGMTTLLVLSHPAAFEQYRHWQVGALGGARWSMVAIGAPLVAAGGLLALALGRALNASALGDDLARALGSRVALIRVCGVVAIALLAGTATALVGPIAFLGLVVPHIARSISGPDEPWVLAYSMLLAPALLLCADIVGRLALPHGEMQAGLVTALIGGPALIVLVRRARWVR